MAPNQPETVDYVMTLDRREPATFSALYAPNSDVFRYTNMAMELASRQQESSGWVGSASRPASSPTGFHPTRSRRMRQPEARSSTPAAVHDGGPAAADTELRKGSIASRNNSGRST